ncbi:MAG: formylglycine-generating enzyme family protein, partial [Thiolinea sp.]
SYPANHWGLHEMHGNIWEWCQDELQEYSPIPKNDPFGTNFDGEKILRGGSWFHDGGSCRSASRYGYNSSDRHSSFGFRLARTP